MDGAVEAGFDLRALLGATEKAAPVDSLAVMAAGLRAMVEAEEVSFLISDFSGDALIRFVRSTPGQLVTPVGDDAFETVPLSGTPLARAIPSQTVEVVRRSEVAGWWLYAPVTDRGDAIGVLQ